MKQRSTLLLLVVEVIQGSREAEKTNPPVTGHQDDYDMRVFDGAWRDVTRVDGAWPL